MIRDSKALLSESWDEEEKMHFPYGHSNKSKWLLSTPLFQGCIAHIFSIIQKINANSSLCRLPAFSQGPFHVRMGKLTGAHVHFRCFRSTCEAAEHKEICMYNICKFTLRSSEAKRTQKGRRRLNHVTLPLGELPATCKQHSEEGRSSRWVYHWAEASWESRYSAWIRGVWRGNRWKVAPIFIAGFMTRARTTALASINPAESVSHGKL